MAALNFPEATFNGQPFEADTGVIYVYQGNPPNGFWSATSTKDGQQNQDARYVQVTGDDMTGNLTFNTSQIELNATTGAATFASSVTSGPALTDDAEGGIYLRQNIGGSSQRPQLLIKGNTGANPVFQICEGGIQNANIKATISNDGSAFFADSITVEDGGKFVANKGGYVYIKPETLDGVALDIYSSDGDSVANIKGDGSAEFAGGDIGLKASGEYKAIEMENSSQKYAFNLDGITNNLRVYNNTSSKTFSSWRSNGDFYHGGGLTNGSDIADPNISLNANGSASFQGNVGIGTTAGVPKLKVMNELGTGAINLADFIAPLENQNALVRLIGRNATNTGATSVDFYKVYQSGFSIINYDTDPANFTGFAIGGSEKMRIDSSGNVGIGTTNPEESLDTIGAITWRGGLITGKTSAGALDRSGNDIRIRAYGVTPGTGELVFRTGGGGGSVDSEAARIDSSGRLLIGTTSAPDGPIYCVDSGNGRDISGELNADNVFGFRLVNYKSRGSNSSKAVVNNNDELGNIVFKGYDGVAYRDGAFIQAFVDGTPGTNDMPGRLVFSTTADGASDPTERMRIDSSGNVGIGATSPLARLHIESDELGVNVNDDNYIFRHESFRNGNSDQFQIYEVRRADATGVTGNWALSDTVIRRNIDNTFDQHYINFRGARDGFPLGIDLGLGAEQAPALTVTSGNIGIGTLEPSYALDVVGRDTGVVGYTCRLRADADGRPVGLQFTNNTASKQYGIIVADDAQNIDIVPGIGGSVVRVRSNGDVFIDTNTANQSNIALSGSTGNGTFAGTVTANGTILTRASGDLDVGERLEKADTALQTLKTAAAAASDFNALKAAIATALADI